MRWIQIIHRILLNVGGRDSQKQSQLHVFRK